MQFAVYVLCNVGCVHGFCFFVYHELMKYTRYKLSSCVIKYKACINFPVPCILWLLYYVESRILWSIHGHLKILVIYKGRPANKPLIPNQEFNEDLAEELRKESNFSDRIVRLWKEGYRGLKRLGRKKEWRVYNIKLNGIDELKKKKKRDAFIGTGHAID